MTGMNRYIYNEKQCVTGILNSNVGTAVIDDMSEVDLLFPDHVIERDGVVRARINLITQTKAGPLAEDQKRRLASSERRKPGKDVDWGSDHCLSPYGPARLRLVRLARRFIIFGLRPGRDGN